MSFIDSNNMKMHSNVKCVFNSFVFFEETFFDVYTNDKFIVLIKNRNFFFHLNELFDDNYLIIKDFSENDIPVDFFINYVKSDYIKSNFKEIEVNGIVFSKRMFVAKFSEIGKINIKIEGV